MSFNNQLNRVSLTGYISSELISNNSYSIEFLISVKRKGKPGEKTFTDTFSVYVSKPDTIAFCKAQLKQNMPVQVKGELRNWVDKSVKICCDEIILKG